MILFGTTKTRRADKRALTLDIHGPNDSDTSTCKLRPARSDVVRHWFGRLVALHRTYLTPTGAANFDQAPQSSPVAVAAGRRYSFTLDGGGDAQLHVMQYVNGKRVRTSTKPGSMTLRVDTHPQLDALSIALRLNRGAFVPDRLTLRITDLGPLRPLENILLLIGAMKAGTTTLYHYLVQHPRIFGNRISKEPHFFSSAENYAKGPLEYAFQYDPEASDPGNFAFDASTHYAKHPFYPDVPERIAKFPGNFSFMYLLRNPFDRIESHLAHNLAMHEMSSDDPELWEHALNTTRYAMQLDRYHEVFDNPRFLLLDFDELKREPIGMLRQIEDFLGLEPYDYQDVGATNPRKTDRVKLTDDQRRTISNELADDIQRLVDVYGFTPAKRWLAE
ncbi:MAG TPA: sulfotransferase domain-containing protein [Actinopolymorphaceae bacterium]|jgi:hypothetical protein